MVIFHHFKILPKVLHPFVKFDGKHDGEVAELVRPTVFESDPDTTQKWVPVHPKMVPPNFDDGFEFSDLENNHNRRFFQMKRIYEF